MTAPQPIPILEYRKQVRADLAEAEWSGDDARAAVLRRELDRVEQDIAAGEMWEVPF